MQQGTAFWIISRKTSDESGFLDFKRSFESLILKNSKEKRHENLWLAAAQDRVWRRRDAQKQTLSKNARAVTIKKSPRLQQTLIGVFVTLKGSVL